MAVAMSSYELNALRRRAHTIARKATNFHTAILGKFGTCALTEAAAALAQDSLKMLEHIDGLIIGDRDP